MTQQKEIHMRNIVARHHEEFIQSTLKQPFRLAFIIILIVLDRVYSWLPGFVPFISKLAPRDAATYGLIFTILISLAGFCAFPPKWISRTSGDAEERCDKSIFHRPNEGCERLALTVELAFACAIIMGAISWFFTTHLHTSIASSENQQNLTTQRQSNPLMYFPQTLFFAPIAEELIFRHFLIGFITSRLINRIASSKSSSVQQKIPLLKSSIPCICILLSGILFGLSHERNFNFIMAGYATHGVILGFAYYIGKGHVIHSILPHMLYNLIFAS